MKKDELTKIYSWQYLNCVSLWVKFVSCNSKNYDLQQLVFSIIGVIKGIAHLFFGPRYMPLRFKCVKMLNQLSSSCGVFIPIESLLFDCLEIRGPNNADGMKQKYVDLALLLKVPKQLLKSQDFHQEIVLSAIKLLAEHLSQWCYHVSFPELATIPLILLKRFHDNTSLESARRPVKRLIDQVQQNSDFIQRKRDEASFSPKDKESVDNFLLLPVVRTLAEIAQGWSHRMVSQTPALPCQDPMKHGCSNTSLPGNKDGGVAAAASSSS